MEQTNRNPTIGPTQNFRMELLTKSHPQPTFGYWTFFTLTEIPLMEAFLAILSTTCLVIGIYFFFVRARSSENTPKQR
jgi:hypothetical protein